MQSFRHEQELALDSRKALVEKDVLELAKKIADFKEGVISEDQFRSLRLARGVYGQRQHGVQMVRIKLPFGKISTQQVKRIAEIADKYSDGLLHLTTRQDVQIYHVSLDDTPQLWEELEQDDITLREACGNTVRNITTSAHAGIDPDELYDVTPYTDALFRYFLRKPFAQELGRKIKMAFSATEADDALTYIHDFGFIPQVQNGQKGFKVLLGGGLGAQPFFAQVVHEFLPIDELIPFVEASIRVFDRYGERSNRNKARLKYLLAKIGLDEFKSLVELESAAVQYDPTFLDSLADFGGELPKNEGVNWDKLYALSADTNYRSWLKLNVKEQKQQGWLSVGVKVPLGNVQSHEAKLLAALFDSLGISDIRLTIQQGILLRYVDPAVLGALFEGLKKLGFAAWGVNSISDVTACPGTETCNLAISNSTHVALAIEDFIQSEYPELVGQSEIRVKISGCMNACGQHGIATIGLHGSSQKVNGFTVPALQLLLGGGTNRNGSGRIGEKVIKFPSKRVLTILRVLLDDYLENSDDELFNEYYDRRGNKYFYDLLKPIADTQEIAEEEYIDWGSDERFKTAIGVGECAGVVIDLVATLFYDVDEKIEKAKVAIAAESWADAAYHTYSAGVIAAKAYLLKSNIRCNTHQGIINDFDAQEYRWLSLKEGSFSSLILQIKLEPATGTFSINYLQQINAFVEEVKEVIKQ
jgi:sulfite reductase (ferredoxin)